MIKNIKRYFSFEAVFFALMAATSESYALYYYSKIDGNQMAIGLLSTVPLLCGALTQYFLSLKEFKISNKLGIFLFQFLQLIGLALIVLNHLWPSLWTLFAGMICYWVGGLNALPFWMDWTSNLIKFEQYGPFLNLRSRLLGIISLIVFLASSYWLNFSDVFLYVFMTGLLARVVSFAMNMFLLVQNQEFVATSEQLTLETQGNEETSIILKIIFPLAFFRLSVNLASPFFLPFMTRELALTPVYYAILTAMPLVARILVLGNWIKINQGAKPFQVIQICALGISILPVLWAINSNFYFVLFYQFLSGFFWSGMEFSSTLMIQNFTYGRSRLLFSKLNAMSTFFTVVGAIGGGLLFYYNFNYDHVFSLSSVVRFLSALFLIYALKKIPQTKLQLRLIRPILMSAISMRPSHANAFKVLFGRKG